MKKAKIIVSEPWDFGIEKNDNSIVGTILSQIDEYTVIFKAESPVQFTQGISDLFELHPRYQGDKFSIQTTVNGALLNEASFLCFCV